MIKNWPNQLRALLWGFFWLSNLWVAADYHLIQSNGPEINLFIFAVWIQVLPLKQRWMNLVIQFAAAIAVLLSYHYFGWIGSGKWMLLFMQAARSALVLGLYFSSMYWLTARRRMLAGFAVTIALYGLLDAYGTKLVWDKAALIVFSGLCLLVLRQLEEIRLRRPSVWSYLAEYPGSLGTPIAIVIGITMVFGLLAPSLPSVIPTGGPDSGGSGAHSYAQSGSSDSSLSSSSGYSRDDQKLGGGFQFDYARVIQVDTTQATYLRGETRSFYSGQGWEQSRSGQQTQLNAVSVAADQLLGTDLKLDTSRLQTVDVTQTVTMLTEVNYPVLFGAYSISQIQPSQTEGGVNVSALRWSAYQAELHFNGQRNQSFPHIYTVVSKVPIVDETALRKVAKLPDPAAMPDELQLPSSLPNRVKQLALTITQNQSTNYDKVKSIEQYLSSHYTYNNLPTPPVPGEDFVDHFLFVSKQGYCDHFSTAMVILTRCLGIPARWVKGYTAGALQLDDQGQLLNGPNASTAPQGPGVYTILNSDAHSWVEVYFPGFGWIPFEPTSGFRLPTIVPDTPLSDIPAVVAPASAMSKQKRSVYISLQSLLAAILGMVIALAAAVWLVRSSLWFKFNYWILKRRAISRKQRITLEFRKLVYSVRRKGLLHFPYETLRETFGRWANQRPAVQRELADLLMVLEKAKYAPSDISTAEFAQVVELVKSVSNNLRSRGKK